MRKCRTYSFRKQKTVDWSLHYRQLYFCLHSLGHPQFVSLAQEEVDRGLQHLLHLLSRTRNCSSSTRAQGTARRTPHGAAPSPSSSSQSSSPVVESLQSVSRSVSQKEKEWNRRERDGVQRIQRERADNMRRGQQAQPHSSHTTRRHPRKEGTQRQQPLTMHEEKTFTTISPSSSLQPQGNGKNPRPPHNAHGVSTHHTSHTRKRTLIHP
ncbi:hypothetical protein ECC02_011138 [Trypanosoma cruzi]|uniref:Uncharacterized protein n=1 Tax=Trypanosoma cruzi TaxID=5693 RepID=A0A7J6XNP4_TRYCR|nr:hypothetical protein ECC02_011138 [Trypanosoma cruzi]